MTMKLKVACLFLLVHAGFFAVTDDVTAASQAMVPLKPIQETSIFIDKIVIENVMKGEPADKAGILKGDVILSLDGRTFNDAGEMHKFLAKHNKTMHFKILRNGQEIAFALKPNTNGPRFGLSYAYYSNGVQVFPKIFWENGNTAAIRGTAAIDQWQLKSNVRVGMGLYKDKVLHVLLLVGNQGSEDLSVRVKEDIRVFEKGHSESLVQLDKDDVRRVLEEPPNERTLERETVTLASDTGEYLYLYYDARNTKPPYEIRMKFWNDSYQFEFIPDSSN